MDRAGKATLQTVADAVGVSRMTVSNAYSRPDQLSPNLRTRILATAEELGYPGPDPAGRALRRGTANTVGVILPRTLDRAFFDSVTTRFLASVAAELAPTGFAITLLSASATGQTVSIRDVAVDGALVCSADVAGLDWLHQRRVPIVFVDQEPRPDRTSINIDDYEGARAAAQHLVELGHRRVGLMIVGGPDHSGIVEMEQLHPDWVHRERLRGWLEPLASAGGRWLIAASQLNAYDVAHEMLRRPDRPTAVLCFSDGRAHQVLAAAADLGLRVPDELSVVGFDDSSLARAMRPELTTVHQDIEQKGRLAATALRRAMEDASSNGSAVEQFRLPADLVIRASTAPPRSL